MDEFAGLVDEAWQIRDFAQGLPFIVRPSIPVLYFGDSQAYFDSPRRIVTAALNPSIHEFPSHAPDHRFPRMQDLLSGPRGESFIRNYRCSLDGYFQKGRRPYDWFETYHPLLSGMSCSFGSESQNTALHTDLCTPLATNPTWSGLTHQQRAELQSSGVTLWIKLIKYLRPHAILISVAEGNLSAAGFPPLYRWSIFHTIQRKNPYHIRLHTFQAGNETVNVIFGRAAQKPFGLLSNAAKFETGAQIAGTLFTTSEATAGQEKLS